MFYKGKTSENYVMRGKEARGRDAVDIRATTVALILSRSCLCHPPQETEREGRTNTSS